MAVVVASFLVCIAVFAAIGLASARGRSSTPQDYLVASRNVSPWLTALSSVATNNSGFMFIGLLGFTYRFGVQAVWLQLGWIIGDVIVWMWIHRRVREVSGELGVSSVPALLASDADGAIARPVVIVAGLLTLVFLGGYAAAQLDAGSTALHVLFGWDARIGLVLGAMVVVAYCFAGGLRASIWTDAAQAFVMLGSMAALLGYAMIEVGGPMALLDRLHGEDPALVQWIPTAPELGFGIYLLGFVFGGLGVLGQPHILIRTMAIRSADDIPLARRVYFLWYVPFSIAAVGAGLYARVLLPDLLHGVSVADAAAVAEGALPALAVELLPAILVGTLLAGVFAATMSTADSQIISCSAALTQDLAPRWRDSYLASKVGTVLVTAGALAFALHAGDDVFSLVLGAWSALGATLGPLLLLRVLGREVPPMLAVAMMAVGLATVFAWNASSHAGAAFDLLPGMLAPLLLYALTSALVPTRS
ncbi:MAG TPA: sodium/proline symporter [Kofleriaceae bacterium]|nr:sodium/proline symporter [Kofleriaceae bacterium]